MAFRIEDFNINGSILLPYVIELITETPSLASNVDDLMEHIKDKIVDKYTAPFGSLKAAINYAIFVAEDMGMINVKTRTVRLPFNFRKNASIKPDLLSMQWPVTAYASCKNMAQRRELQRKRTLSAQRAAKPKTYGKTRRSVKPRGSCATRKKPGARGAAAKPRARYGARKAGARAVGRAGAKGKATAAKRSK